MVSFTGKKVYGVMESLLSILWVISCAIMFLSGKFLPMSLSCLLPKDVSVVHIFMSTSLINFELI